MSLRAEDEAIPKFHEEIASRHFTPPRNDMAL